MRFQGLHRPVEARPIHGYAGCAQWSSYEVPFGESFGPVPVCFAVPPDSSDHRLVWSPDMGLVSPSYMVPVRPTYAN